MQLTKPPFSIPHTDTNPYQPLVSLSPATLDRLRLVDSLIDSNNGIDTMLSVLTGTIGEMQRQLTALSGRYERLCALVVEVDGDVITLGELAERKDQLMDALTFTGPA